MSGNKCCYFNCGKSARKYPGLRKFAFPVNDPVRCEKWIIHSGNAELATLTSSELSKKVICGDHFRKEDVLVRTLASGAVPLKYDDDSGGHVGQQKRTYQSASRSDLNSDRAVGEDRFSPQPSTSAENIDDTIHIVTPKKQEQPLALPSQETKEKNFIDDLIQLPSPKRTQAKKKLVMPETPRKKRLREKLKSATSELKSVKQELRKKEKSMFTCARNLNSLPPMSRSITRMQLHHKPRTQWLSDEKNTAISMYYKSPSMYKYLRKNGVILPSVSIIKKWLKDFNCQPGYNKNFFRKLDLKGQTMTNKEKMCIIMFDEMATKQEIEYSLSKELIEGFEDLGEFGRKDVAAKQVLVFLVRGLYSDWKLPISYYFSENGVNAEVLEKILKKNLDLLKDIGLSPSAIVCDQSTTNQKLFRKLEIREEKPYFHYKGRKYFCLFDVPHLLKSIRNNLLAADFILDSDVISFDVIRSAYQIDSMSRTGKALLKISEKHLNPNAFQKMSVRLAAQILSHSVSAAIKTAIRTNQLSLTQALPTANFIEMVDKLFDALNSKNLYSKKPCNQALSDSHKEVIDAMEHGYQVFKRIQKIDKKGKKVRPPCFEGVLISINAIRQLFEENKKEGYSFLLTGRMNQDPLENLFSKFRQKGGYNRNPTVRTFQTAFKSNLIVNLMKTTEHGNCEPDEDHNLFENDEIPEWASSEPEEDSSQIGVSVKSVTSSSDGTEPSPSTSRYRLSSDQETSSVSLEECAIVYFAGYLIRKCLQNFNDCANCKQNFESNDSLVEDNRLLIFYKNYNIEKPCALKNPTSEMIFFTKNAMSLVAEHLTRIWVKKKFATTLKNIIIDKICTYDPNWFKNNCKSHREYLVDLLIKVLIFKECKYYSRNIKSRTTKKSTKLSILQHN